ncbi:hypothetical protein ABT275_40855 [Streptomyces sp. NPDC001185]|uniref:hypothetical protein n=1 Tax=Streptomyces sp. NPDC001185 TaxID=3154380 RepID=UPI00331B9DC2
MFAHRSESPPSSRWDPRRIPRDGSGRFRCTRIPTRVYDAMLVLLVVLALTQHVLGRGLLLAAYLVFRLTNRHLSHSRRVPSLPGRQDHGQRS